MGSEMPEYNDGIDGYIDNPIQRRRILVRDLNICLTCTLCDGYLIDATVITICLHTFCRSCIVRYLESSRYCPTCDIQVHKSKPLTALRTDKSLQLLLYKLIPSVYQNEVKRRSDFYSNARASSSCSEDSILTDSEAHEQSVLSHINDSTHQIEFFSPDDSISLSLEYYKDIDDFDTTATPNLPPTESESIVKISQNGDINDTPPVKRESDIKDLIDSKLTNGIDEKPDINIIEDNKSLVSKNSIADNNENIVHKRYLQCPAGVNIKHLTKFIRMKYGLSFQHRVDIIYEDEILPKNFTLMDVAYTFKWNRRNPMRFMYRIFESTKTPIFKTVYRQQDVTINNHNTRPKTPDPSPPATNTASAPIEPNKNNTSPTTSTPGSDTTTEKSTLTDDTSLSDEPDEEAPVVEDTQDDDDLAKRLRDKEIQEFAKKRDLEWANLIRQSEDTTPSVDSKKVANKVKKLTEKTTPTKKRKKSKHSKHLANYSKRRKLHHYHYQIEEEAEVEKPAVQQEEKPQETTVEAETNKNTDILKLKVKLTPTIHKISPTITTGTIKPANQTTKPSKPQTPMTNSEFKKLNDITKELQVKTVKLQTVNLDNGKPQVQQSDQKELSTKERLLQMRQVRHKVTKNTTNEVQQPPPTKKVRFNDDETVAPPVKTTNKCVPNLVAPKSFTVTMNTSSSVSSANNTADTNKKRKESSEIERDSKIPSLEIMLINPKTPPVNNSQSSAKVTPQVTQTLISKPQNAKMNNTKPPVQNTTNNGGAVGRSLSLMQSKMLMMKNLNLTQINKTSSGTIQTTGANSGMEVTKMPTNNNTAKQIPLSKIKKLSQQQPSQQKSSQQNNKTTISALIKQQQQNGAPNKSSKVDNFGALDLSRKSPETTAAVSFENNNKQIKIEDVQKIVQSKQHLTNLHILSESAVHIRDLMVSAQNKNMSQTPPTTAKKDFTILSTPNTTTSAVKTSIVLPQQKQPATTLTPIVNKTNLLNKSTASSVVTTTTSQRLSVPSLPQALRIPALQQHKVLQNQMRTLQKMPKLQEISKNNLVTTSASLHPFANQIRATPNQTVRNIPNPSALLARHAQAVQALNASTAATIPPSSVTNTINTSVAKLNVSKPTPITTPPTPVVSSTLTSVTKSDTKPIGPTTNGTEKKLPVKLPSPVATVKVSQCDITRVPSVATSTTTPIVSEVSTNSNSKMDESKKLST